MSIFYSGDVTLAASSASKVVDASEVDRKVYLSATSWVLGFSSAEVTGRTSTGPTPGEFVLPAGKELWMYNPSGAAVVGVLVTALKS